MANTAQAKKRARQNIKRRERNMAHRSRMRTLIKNVTAAIETGDKTAATEAYKVAQPIIDSMVNKGIIHKNKAARIKSRMNAHIKKIAA